MEVSGWFHQPPITFVAVERYRAIMKPFSSNLQLGDNETLVYIDNYFLYQHHPIALAEGVINHCCGERIPKHFAE